MRIRYQDGSAIEGITLSQTSTTLRVAVKGQDDVMEFNNINGAWVSEDCEPVILETGSSARTPEAYSADQFICSKELASHLIRLLLTDSVEDVLDEPAVFRPAHARSFPLIG